MAFLRNGTSPDVPFIDDRRKRDRIEPKERGSAGFDRAVDASCWELEAPKIIRLITVR